MKKNNRVKYVSLLLVIPVLLEIVGSFFWKFDFAELVLFNLFLIISVLEMTRYISYQSKVGFITGHNLFLVFWTVWLFFAWWGKYYYVSHNIWYDRNSSILFSKFFLLNIFALLTWIIFYSIGTKMKIKNAARINLNLEIFSGDGLSDSNIERSDKCVSTFILALICVAVVFYIDIGGITIFYSGNIDEYRFQVQNISSVFNYVNYAIPLLVIMKAYFCMILKKIHIFDVIIMGLALMVSIFYGAKMLVVFPIITIVFLYYFINPSKDFLNIKMIVLGVICIVGATIYTNMRGLGRTISDGLVADILLFFGGEFRDASRFITLVDEQDIYIVSIFDSIIKLTPEAIRNFLGIESYITDTGMQIKEMLGYTYAGGSARVGILTEMYFNGRWGAVFCAFLILGVVFAKVDKLLIKSKTQKYSWRHPFLYMLLFQLTWLIVAETYIQIPAIVIYVLLFVFLELFIEKLAKRK